MPIFPQEIQQHSYTIQAGDILLEYHDGSSNSNLTSFGQRFGKGPNDYYHAGIAASSSTMYELGGNGLFHTDLREKIGTYQVYRCLDRRVAEEATQFARETVGAASNYRQKNGGIRIDYRETGYKSAFSSIWARQRLRSDIDLHIADKMATKKPLSFFCSSHVVLCYQVAIARLKRKNLIFNDALEQIFKLEHHCYQPAYLVRRLDKTRQFRSLGAMRKGRFLTTNG